MTDEAVEFESNAIELLESFLNGMMGDRRFIIPVEEHGDADGPIDEYWSHVYTDRGQRLAERMVDRLGKLAVKKFGEDRAMDIDISTRLFQE